MEKKNNEIKLAAGCSTPPPGIRSLANSLTSSPGSKAHFDESSNDSCSSFPLSIPSKYFLENDPVSTCIPAARENASQNAVFIQPTTKPVNSSPLHCSANPYVPGSIDALVGVVCGDSNSLAPSSSSLPSKIPDNPQQEAASGVHQMNPAAVHRPTNAVPPPRAWSRKVLIKFSAQAEPMESYKRNGIISLDEEEAAEISKAYDNALVGRVVGKNFSFNWLAKQLQAKWGALEGFLVNDLGEGCFILFFANRECRDQVWFGGPWHVAGYVVGLDQWTGKFVPSMNPQMLVPTWVRIPGLQLHFWGDKNLRRIAAAVGEPVYIDAFTKSRTRANYASICVRRNLAAPLLEGIWLYSQETGKFFQKLNYEGIASFCTACGFAGHGAATCMAKPDAGGKICADSNNPRAGLDHRTLVPSRRPQPKHFPGSNQQQRQGLNKQKKALQVA